MNKIGQSYRAKPLNVDGITISGGGGGGGIKIIFLSIVLYYLKSQQKENSSEIPARGIY